MTHDTKFPFDYKHYRPGTSHRLDLIPREYRTDLPLRAQSVSLLERPRSQYGRPVRSAEYSTGLRCSQKLVFQARPQPAPTRKRKSLYNKVIVKQQNRKSVEKIPCTVAVQTLSLPMRYADDPKPTQPTSKLRSTLCNTCKTKSSNPFKQVSDNRKPCETCTGEKETENKLLLQICEAEQVADFERILNSNAILCERARRDVWRSVAANAPSASLVPRPRSTYSLRTVSDAYQRLHQRHHDSLRPLIDTYRRTTADLPPGYSTQSLLARDWDEDIHHLSEYYDDDAQLKREVETITDRILDEELHQQGETSPQSKNFEVNLSGLLGLRVTGDGCSPVQERLSPDVESSSSREAWRPAMSADDSRQDKRDTVDDIAHHLNGVKIDSNEKLPTITFSNCCEGGSRSERPDNSDVAAHLAVPSVDSDESRPPIM